MSAISSVIWYVVLFRQNHTDSSSSKEVSLLACHQSGMDDAELSACTLFSYVTRRKGIDAPGSRYPYTALRTAHARSVTHLLSWPCLSISTQVLPLEAASFLQRPDGSCLLRSQ